MHYRMRASAPGGNSHCGISCHVIRMLLTSARPPLRSRSAGRTWTGALSVCPRAASVSLYTLFTFKQCTGAFVGGDIAMRASVQTVYVGCRDMRVSNVSGTRRCELELRAHSDIALLVASLGSACGSCGRHNFAFMDCDIFHNEDEMRKQALFARSMQVVERCAVADARACQAAARQGIQSPCHSCKRCTVANHDTDASYTAVSGRWRISPGASSSPARRRLSASGSYVKTCTKRLCPTHNSSECRWEVVGCSVDHKGVHGFRACIRWL